MSSWWPESDCPGHAGGRDPAVMMRAEGLAKIGGGGGQARDAGTMQRRASLWGCLLGEPRSLVAGISLAFLKNQGSQIRRRLF